MGWQRLRDQREALARLEVALDAAYAERGRRYVEDEIEGLENAISNLQDDIYETEGTCG